MPALFNMNSPPPMHGIHFPSSLYEVLHCDRKLYLVFEYLDYDLKKYMDKHMSNGIPHDVVKVSLFV